MFFTFLNKLYIQFSYSIYDINKVYKFLKFPNEIAARSRLSIAPFYDTISLRPKFGNFSITYRQIKRRQIMLGGLGKMSEKANAFWLVFWQC